MDIEASLVKPYSKSLGHLQGVQMLNLVQNRATDFRRPGGVIGCRGLLSPSDCSNGLGHKLMTVGTRVGRNKTCERWPRVTVHRDRRLKRVIAGARLCWIPRAPNFCIVPGRTRRGVDSTVERPARKAHRNCRLVDARSRSYIVSQRHAEAAV
jgi:hypothetical protein